MSETTCPTCGTICRIVGDTTLHYEPVESPLEISWETLAATEGERDEAREQIKQLRQQITKAHKERRDAEARQREQGNITLNYVRRLRDCEKQLYEANGRIEGLKAEIEQLREENRRLLVVASWMDGDVDSEAVLRVLGEKCGPGVDPVLAMDLIVREYAERGRELVEGKRDE